MRFTNKVHNSPCRLRQVNAHKWEHFQNVRLGLATTLFTLVGYSSMVRLLPYKFSLLASLFNTQLVFPLGLLGWGLQGMGEWPLILGCPQKKIKRTFKVLWKEELQVLLMKEPAKELAVQSRFFLWKRENWPTLVAKFQGFFFPLFLNWQPSTRQFSQIWL